MELREIKVKTKCDNGACRNMADYVIYRQDTMSSQSLRLCKECLAKIAELAKPLKTKQKSPKTTQNKPKTTAEPLGKKE
ncbi:MAG: hypothetical protein IJ033_02925 [Clostridia bacterium]|nr:hypothetical protein [Clostridia bacterium]